jgi:hypothetical protein
MLAVVLFRFQKYSHIQHDQTVLDRRPTINPSCSLSQTFPAFSGEEITGQLDGKAPSASWDRDRRLILALRG